jgi:GPI mannosyltransferase 3
VFGAADWIVWGGFFHSYVEAVRANLVQGRASHFGTEPPQWYAEQLYYQWRYALPLLAIFIFVRARAAAMWILAALVIIAVHSAIPHKEYRFILPACASLVIVAAMGSADLLERAGRLVRPLMHQGLVFFVALLWLEISVALAFAPQFGPRWFKARQYIMASFAVTAKADLCGLLFYDNFWFNTGGYAYLHRNVPFYTLQDDETLKPEKSSLSFNAVVLNRSSVADFVSSFHVQQCFSSPVSEDVCLLVRDGPCVYEKDMDVFLAPGASLLGADELTRPAK